MSYRTTLLLTLTLGIWVSACGSKEGSSAFGRDQVIYLKAAALRHASVDAQPDGRWDPTEQQADEAYEALQTYLSKPADELDRWSEEARQDVAKNLRNYRFRVTGQTATRGDGSLSGLKFVNLEGVCEGMAKAVNWKKPDFVVMDGGSCFFDAAYDPKSRAIVAFSTHGLA